MADGATFSIDTSDLLSSINRWQPISRKSEDAVMKQETKLLIQEIIELTPPGGGGRKGNEAKKVGEGAILRDTGKVFSGVRIKGRRKITQVFGHVLKKPVYVPTKELAPDLDAIQEVRKKSRHGGKVTRGRGQAYYVSKTKLKILRNRLKAQVGILASGWINGYEALGGRAIPAWMKRHANLNRGSNRIQTDAGGISISVTAQAGGPAFNALRGRVASAVFLRRNAIERKIIGLQDANAKAAGFKTA